jgi:hypothetical protein
VSLGEIECLLAAVRATTFARDESGGQEAGYGLETEAASLDGPFIEAALAAGEALAALRKPLIQLGLRLEAIMDEPPDWLDGRAVRASRGARIAELACRSDRRVGGFAGAPVGASRSCLCRLAGGGPGRWARI